SRRKCRPWLWVEVLEDRCVPATITVTSLADPTDINFQKVTLRQAIQAANTNQSVNGSTAGAPGADTIVFQDGLTGTIQLEPGVGDLTIKEPLTIRGLGAANTVIQGKNGIANTVRIFQMTATAGDVTLEGLTLSQGGTSGNNSGGAFTFS